MILVYEGPIIWMMLVAIVLYFGYKKEKKESQKIQNNIDKIDAKLNERKIINTQASGGKMTFLRKDFKELNDNDLKLYSDIYGVKFI